MAKKARPSWCRGTQLRRHLGLMKWLARQARWVPTLELAESTYGVGLAARRRLHRDLRALQRAGVPVEDKYGYWRLRKPTFNTWLRETA